MTLSTLCPKCNKPIGVPIGTHESAEVRCPLCDEQFPLCDATGEDVPVVIVVDPGAAIEVAEPDVEESGAGAVTFGEGIMADGLAEEADIEEIATDEGERSEDAASDTFDLQLEDSLDDDATLSFQVADDSSGKESGDDALSFGALGDGDHDSEAMGDSAMASFGDGDDEATSATAQRIQAPKKGAGLKGQLIGVVLFGIVGLGLGYGILRFVKPSATAPFDKAFNEAWLSVTSLWSSDVESQSDSSGPSRGFPKPGEYLGNSADVASDAPATNTTAPVDAGLAIDVVPDIVPWDPSQSPTAVPPSVKLGFRGFLLEGEPDSADLFRTFEVEEVATALTTAAEAATNVSEKLTPKFFFGFCDLGERLAGLQDVSSPRAVAQQSEVEALLLASSRPELYRQLAGFSYQWLQFDRRPASKAADRGVFLVGEVQRVVPYGPLTASTIKVEKGDRSQTVLVLTRDRPAYHVHDKAAVLGSAVRNPSAVLPRMIQMTDLPEADPSLVILGGAAVKLPEGDGR